MKPKTITQELEFEHAHIRTVERIGEIGEITKLRRVEFFFYATNFDNAADVANELILCGYKCKIHKPDAVSGDWSIIAYAKGKRIDNKSFWNWVRRMEDIAKKHNSLFDGWGAIA